MRPGRAVAQLRELARVSATASRAYGVSRLGVARLARRLRLEGGFEYAEALGEGLLSPDCPEERRRHCISRHVRRARQDRLNPPGLEPFTEQKLVFYEYCAAVGIPVPRLYGTVGRRGGWSRVSGRPIEDEEGLAELLLHEAPDEVLIKPVFGLLGLGVRALFRTPAGLRDSGGAPVDPAALWRELSRDPEFEVFLVQELLHNHPAVEELVASPVLQTLRIDTLIDAEGRVHVLDTRMKLATGRGDADNWRGGTTGNGYCDVSEDGRLGPLLVPDPGGIGFRVAASAPRTGRRLEGWRVPMVDEARQLAVRGAPHFMPMRTLGWDIALTPNGPVVVEANNYWAMAAMPLSSEARELFLRG